MKSCFNESISISKYIMIFCLFAFTFTVYCVDISYVLPKAGRVSLAIYDSQNHQVRTLLNADQQDVGKQIISWDGLDSAGKPTAAGKYTWKLLTSQGMKSEYLFSVGTSYKEKAWPGQHGGIASISCENGFLYLTSASSEGSPQNAKISINGDYQWVSPTLEGWDGGSDISVDGKKLYFQSQNGNTKKNNLYLLDAMTGERQRTVSLNIGTVDKPVKPELVDSFNDQLVSASHNGHIAWVNPDNYTIIDSLTIDNGLRDIALTKDGRLLILHETSLFSVTRNDKTPIEKINGLTSASRIAIDHVNDNIFIADGGACQQVKQYDADFKLIKTYGKAGGREEGLYEPANFLNVSDIAGDGKGGFVISEYESAPRRTAHFDKDGKVLAEWFGGQQFYTFPAPDPVDPKYVWIDSQWGWIMQCEINPANKTWYPHACYKWGGNTPSTLVGRYKMAVPHWVMRRAANKNGPIDTYIYSGAHSGLLMKVDEAGKCLRPVSILSLLIADDRWGWSKTPIEKLPTQWLDAITKLGENPKDSGSRARHRGFAWTDLNGDNEFQADEFRLYNQSVEHMGGSLWMDQDLNIFLMRGWDTKNKAAWLKFPTQGYTAAGAPIWDWSKFEEGPVTPYTSSPALCGDNDGNIYVIQYGGKGDGYAADGTYGAAHGFAWPANQTDSNAISKYDKDKNLLWQSGYHAAKQNNLPGQLQYPCRIAGIVNGTIGVCDKVVQPVIFWTEDGLYAGSIFDRHADDGLPASVYTWWSTDPNDRGFNAQSPFQYDMLEGGSLVKSTNGDVLFYGSGWNNCPVYRITGWNQFSRQNGTIEITGTTPTPALAKGSGLKTQYFMSADLSGKELIVPEDEAVSKRLWYDVKHPMTILTQPTPDIEKTEITPRDATPGSVRWSGFLEAKYSGLTELGIYGKYVRMWIGGKLMVEGWNSNGSKFFTEPLMLEAGKRIKIVIEHKLPKSKEDFHLVWEGTSQQIEHIPTEYLYMEDDKFDAAKMPLIAIETISPQTDRSKTAIVPGLIKITRNGNITKPVKATLIVSGNAQAGIDYKPLPRYVAFAENQSSVDLQITPLPEKIPTMPTTVSVSVQVSHYYLIDSKATGSISIYNSNYKPIQGVTVTSPDATDDIKKIVDGSGLNMDTVPVQHDLLLQNQWYTRQPYKEKNPTMTFDLGSIYDLKNMHVWNYNDERAFGGDKSVGAKTVDIYISENLPDNLQFWGTVVFPRATNTKTYIGNDIPIKARTRYVKFIIRNIYDYPWDTPLVAVGLAEVWFYGDKIK